MKYIMRIHSFLLIFSFCLCQADSYKQAIARALATQSQLISEPVNNNTVLSVPVSKVNVDNLTFTEISRQHLAEQIKANTDIIKGFVSHGCFKTSTGYARYVQSNNRFFYLEKKSQISDADVHFFTDQLTRQTLETPETTAALRSNTSPVYRTPYTVQPVEQQESAQQNMQEFNRSNRDWVQSQEVRTEQIHQNQYNQQFNRVTKIRTDLEHLSAHTTDQTRFYNNLPAAHFKQAVEHFKPEQRIQVLNNKMFWQYPVFREYMKTTPEFQQWAAGTYEKILKSNNETAFWKSLSNNTYAFIVKEGKAAYKMLEGQKAQSLMRNKTITQQLEADKNHNQGYIQSLSQQSKTPFIQEQQKTTQLLLNAIDASLKPSALERLKIQEVDYSPQLHGKLGTEKMHFLNDLGIGKHSLQMVGTTQQVSLYNNLFIAHGIVPLAHLVSSTKPSAQNQAIIKSISHKAAEQALLGINDIRTGMLTQAQEHFKSMRTYITYAQQIETGALNYAAQYASERLQQLKNQLELRQTGIDHQIEPTLINCLAACKENCQHVSHHIYLRNNNKEYHRCIELIKAIDALNKGDHTIQTKRYQLTHQAHQILSKHNILPEQFETRIGNIFDHAMHQQMVDLINRAAQNTLSDNALLGVIRGGIIASDNKDFAVSMACTEFGNAYVDLKQTFAQEFQLNGTNKDLKAFVEGIQNGVINVLEPANLATGAAFLAFAAVAPEAMPVVIPAMVATQVAVLTDEFTTQFPEMNRAERITFTTEKATELAASLATFKLIASAGKLAHLQLPKLTAMAEKTSKTDAVKQLAQNIETFKKSIGRMRVKVFGEAPEVVSSELGVKLSAAAIVEGSQTRLPTALLTEMEQTGNKSATKGAGQAVGKEVIETTAQKITEATGGGNNCNSQASQIKSMQNDSTPNQQTNTQNQTASNTVPISNQLDIQAALQDVPKICAQLNPRIGNIPILEQAINLFKNVPGAAGNNGPITRVLRFGRQGLTGRDHVNAMGSAFELEVAYKLHQRGEEINAFGKLFWDGNKYVEFDIVTEKSLYECKKIDWTSNNTTFVNDKLKVIAHQNNIAKSHNLSFALISERTFPDWIKTWLNLNNISYFEG